MVHLHDTPHHWAAKDPKHAEHKEFVKTLEICTPARRLCPDCNEVVADFEAVSMKCFNCVKIQEISGLVDIDMSKEEMLAAVKECEENHLKNSICENVLLKLMFFQICSPLGSPWHASWRLLMILGSPGSSQKRLLA